MQKLLLTTLALAGTALAQVPMPAHATTYNGYSRGWSTVAQTGFAIVGLDLPVDAFQAGDTGAYLVFVNGLQVYHSFGNGGATGTAVPAPNILVAPGDTLRVVGNWSPAAPGNFTAHNSYGSGGGTYATNIEGVQHTLHRAGHQWDIGDPVFGGTGFEQINGSMGRVNVYTAPLAGFASLAPFGEGCNEAFASFYENHSTFDLSNTSLLFTNTGVGYVALPGVTPMAPAVSAPVTIGDDQVLQFPLGWTLPYPGGATTDLWISSNGFVNLTTNAASGCCSFNVATFLSNGPVFAAKWRDLNPSSVGTVTFDSDPVAQTATITFSGVPDFGSTTNLNDFQYFFDAAGTVELRFGTVAPTAGGTGWSPGAANADPGSTDLSATPVIITGAVDTVPLALTADARPVLGTNVNVTVENIPTGAVIAAHVYGLGQFNPGLDLTSLGMPGCFQYCTQDAVSLTIAPAGPTATNVFTIPNDPGLAGVIINGQGAAYDPAGNHNALGALSSNGIEFVLDVN